jgi:protease I
VPFVRAMKQHYAGFSQVEGAAGHAQTSAPQRSEPPKVVINAMRWLPRPSIRTAVGLDLLAWFMSSRGKGLQLTSEKGLRHLLPPRRRFAPPRMLRV